MITPDGLQVSLQDVATLFTQRAGDQPGLTIELSEMETLAIWSGGAMIRYRETHRLPRQGAKARISTALFSLQIERILWRHLHEPWSDQLRTVQEIA